MKKTEIKNEISKIFKKADKGHAMYWWFKSLISKMDNKDVTKQNLEDLLYYLKDFKVVKQVELTP